MSSFTLNDFEASPESEGLTGLSTADFATLQRQVLVESERRAALAAEVVRQKRIHKNRLLLDNRSLFLSLIEHGRTSCSDTNTINGYPNDMGYVRCNRCAFLRLDEYNLDSFDIQIDFCVKSV